MINPLPKIDMKTLTRLTREGRLKDAAAILRDGLLRGSDARTAAPARRNQKAAQSDISPVSQAAESVAETDEKILPEIDALSDGLRTVHAKIALKKPLGPFGAINQSAAASPALRGMFDLLGASHSQTQSDERAAPGKNKPVAPGSFIQRSFANEAGSRDYKIYVPKSYCGKPLPLVVMLHGCTQSPDDFAIGTGMNGLADERTFLVAYPSQSRAANAQKCWNWFNAGDQRRDHGEPSLIAGITREIMRDYPVTPDRVYVAGLSAGGAAAAILGDVYPDLYAAVGVHSGLACGAARDMASAFMAMRQGGKPENASLEAKTRVPTIVFHGDRDATVNPVNGDQVIAKAGAGGLHGEVSQGVAPGGLRYTRTIHADNTGKPLLEKWDLHGAGHAWSGGSNAGTYTEPRGPDASREMVRFFALHSRSGPAQ